MAAEPALMPGMAIPTAAGEAGLVGGCQEGTPSWDHSGTPPSGAAPGVGDVTEGISAGTEGR
ncbi:hypothetical protein BD413DRAFT_528450 [Trametes elegans]|nr:hypothetical protein BD413DRAFT_528450 [Trametes elegans]